MKKALILLSVLLLSSCAQTKVVKACQYSIIVSSFLPEADQELCQTVYDAIDSAKFNRRIIDERIFDIFSIHIRFQFGEGDEEFYMINKDGTITYEENDLTYKIDIGEEIVALLIDNIESQKQ